MEQLIMRWKNDGKSVIAPKAPQNCRILNFTELDNALENWLDIVQYGLTNGRCDENFYHQCMTALPLYREDKCFFIVEGETAVATLTVICDYEKKEGQ